MNTMIMKLLSAIIFCLFLPLDIVSQVHTDTLCYKNDTIYQELRITRVNFMAMRMIIIGKNIKMTDMEIHL